MNRQIFTGQQKGSLHNFSVCLQTSKAITTYLRHEITFIVDKLVSSLLQCCKLIMCTVLCGCGGNGWRAVAASRGEVETRYGGGWAGGVTGLVGTHAAPTSWAAHLIPGNIDPSRQASASSTIFYY